MKTEVFKKIDLRTRQFVNTLFLGNYQAAFQGKGLEFSDFREYADGDDAKMIDWVVSSREWKTIVRRYREERELEVLFVLDTSVSMYFWKKSQKIDTLAEVFYILGFSAIKNGDRIGAYLLGDTKPTYIPLSKGNKGLFKIFQSIPQTPSDFINTKIDLSFLIRRNTKKTLLFVISDSLEVDESSFKILSLQHDIIYIHISDTFENTLDGSGIHTLSDGVSEISVDLDNTKKKQLYRKIRQEKMTQLKYTLLQYHIESVFISNSDNPYQKILQLMKQREI